MPFWRRRKPAPRVSTPPPVALAIQAVNDFLERHNGSLLIHYMAKNPAEMKWFGIMSVGDPAKDRHVYADSLSNAMLTLATAIDNTEDTVKDNCRIGKTL